MSEIIGFIKDAKGKNAHVSIVGKDEEVARCIKHQKEDGRIEQSGFVLEDRHPLGGTHFNPL